MKNKKERMAILEKLEVGLLSPEDAANQLQEDPEKILNDLDSPMDVLAALETGKISADQAAEKLGSGVKAQHISENHVSRVDIIDSKQRFNSDAIWIGGLITGLVALFLSVQWMSSRFSGTAGMDFWFFVAWIPFFLGLLLIVISWVSKNSPWLKIRIHSKDGGESLRFNFGFPFPKGLIIWGIRQSEKIVGKGMSSNEFEALFEKLERGKLEEPIVIHVDDDDDNIEIIIG